jgi:hypothetical protein
MSAEQPAVAVHPPDAMVGACMRVSADGEIRVAELAEHPFPLLLEGSYFTAATHIFVSSVPDGERVEIRPLSSGAEPRFVVEWPVGSPASLLELHIVDAERERAGISIPAITLAAPGLAPDAASRFSWRAPAEHGLFDIKIINAETRQVVARRWLLASHYPLFWNELEPSADYRAIVRPHDGQRHTGQGLQLWLFSGPDGFAEEAIDISQEFAALRHAVTTGTEVPHTIPNLDRGTDSRASADELCRILYDAFEGKRGIHRKVGAVDFPAIERLAREAAAKVDGSLHLRDALEYLALYGVVARYFRKQFGVLSPRSSLFSIYDLFTTEHAAALLDRLQQSTAYREGSFAASMVEGLVSSAVDRDQAARCFSRARQENRDMWQHLRLDIGASTYLTAREVIARASERQQTHRQVDSFAFLTEIPTWRQGDHMFLCSCDHGHFRIYFPFWLASAEYLKARRISCHFLVNGAADEVASLVETADSLRRQMARLRGDDAVRHADNISFSTALVPPDVADPTCFYAGSRFLFARRIANRYQGPVMVSDIDMIFRYDPRSYLEAIDYDRIGLYSNTTLAMLKPWRRFLAGTFVLPFSERAHGHLTHLEDYLSAGLSLERSWMLDQNAIAYMVEQVIEAGDRELLVAVSRAGQPRRPTTGDEIRKLFEVRQRQLEGSR